jgi:hypothetical protein
MSDIQKNEQSYGSLPELSANELNELLREAPLDCTPDTDYIDLVLCELDKRGVDIKVDVNAAWENFKDVQNGGDFRYTAELNEAAVPCPPSAPAMARSSRRLARRFLAAAAVFVMAFALAVVAGAFDTIVQPSVTWDDSYLTFEQISASKPLQKVMLPKTYGYTMYSHFQELLSVNKIREKVFPTWLPRGFALTNMHALDGVPRRMFLAYLEDKNEQRITISIMQMTYSRGTRAMYFSHNKDETEVIPYESGGITHYLLSDNDSDTIKAVWSFNGLECSVTIPNGYTYDDLIRIIDSIYKK